MGIEDVLNDLSDLYGNNLNNDVAAPTNAGGSLGHLFENFGGNQGGTRSGPGEAAMRYRAVKKRINQLKQKKNNVSWSI